MSEQILIADFIPSPYQKRRVFDPVELQSLADNIKEVGLINQVVVRKVGKKYELIAGERRVRAMKLLGNETITAKISDASDKLAAAMCASENLKRINLTPMEEAESIEALIGMVTINEAAQRLGRSIPWVARRAALLQLSPKWKKEYLSGDCKAWPVECIELIARMPVNVQDEMLENARFEVPTIKELREQIEERMMKLSAAPWPIDGGKPDCKRCQKRTAAAASLFDEINVAKDDRCLDSECWEKKMKDHLEATAAKLKELSPAIVTVKTDYSNSVLDYNNPLQKGALSPNDFTKSKEGAKGAVPALIVQGPGAGTTIFIKKPTQSQASGSGARPAGPKSMKEKVAALEKRRAIAFIRKVITALESAFKKPPQYSGNLLRALIAAFGAVPLKAKVDGMSYGYDPFKANEKITMSGDGCAELFKCVVPKIIEKLEGECNYGDFKTKNALQVCVWFDINSANIMEDVLKEIPEPKSWAKETAEKPEKKVRACRVCGCTETTPCVDPESGDSCSWVEPDLCSACADKPKKKKAIGGKGLEKLVGKK